MVYTTLSHKLHVVRVKICIVCADLLDKLTPWESSQYNL